MKQKHAELVALGKHIRRLREAKGFSQEYFADLAGLSMRYYSSVERGERNIAARNLIKIAAALKVEVGDLFPSIKTLLSKIKMI